MCDLLQYTTILYTILFDEFYNIVWYCLVLDVGYNIEQYCLSILFGFVCCIVIYCTVPVGTEQSCNNFCNQRHGWTYRDGFAYRIERTEKGGYVLHITNATAILVRNAENGDVGVDLSLCPAICPNLPYTEIFVSYAINDEPIIVRMQSGPKGDLWIREDGRTHP